LDVFADRDLGRAAVGVRRDQVRDLHPGRLGVDARRHLRVLLSHDVAYLRHDRSRPPDLRSAIRVPRLALPLRRIRGEAAGLAVSYLALRRSRLGVYGGQRVPRGRAVQYGRVWDAPLLGWDAVRGDALLGLAARAARRD